MELKSEDLIAARAGQHVKIHATGQTFYLLSEQAYESLDRTDYDAMATDEMDLLADEADALISESETDAY